MRKIIMILLLSGFILLPLIAKEDIHEYKIPSGWKFKSYRSGELFQALFLLADVPEEQLFEGMASARLLVFDKQDNLISDLILEPGWWFADFIDERILLEQGNEMGTYSIKLVDLNGKEIYSLNTQGRWVDASPIGNDLVLKPNIQDGEIGPISIIDGETGREKFRLEPFKGPNGPSMPDCFILIGDGLYLWGKGASLFLQSYHEPNKTYWQIWNIGGNIRRGEAFFLSKDLIIIGYGFDDFEKHIFMSGAAVIEWRTGQLLFNKSAVRRGNNEDKWFNPLNYLNLFVDEDGNLIIEEKDDDTGTLLPPKSGGKKGWDEKSSKKVKFWPTMKELRSSVGNEGRVEIWRNTVIKIFKTHVRIEKRKYIIDSEKH